MGSLYFLRVLLTCMEDIHIMEFTKYLCPIHLGHHLNAYFAIQYPLSDPDSIFNAHPYPLQFLSNLTVENLTKNPSSPAFDAFLNQIRTVTIDALQSSIQIPRNKKDKVKKQEKRIDSNKARFRKSHPTLIISSDLPNYFVH